MGPEKLEENYNAIKKYDQLNRDLAAKVAIVKEAQAREESVRLLLNFELSQILSTIEQTKQELADIEAEQDRLTASNHELGCQLKRIRNYFGFVNTMQADRKAEWAQNFMGYLNSLDFTIEEYQNEPSRSIESFTQFKR